MSNILVTGSKGFIGKNLVKKLLSLGHSVYEFEGDITESHSYKKYSDINFDHCFHLAGKSFVPESWENPAKFIKNNVLGTEKLLELCRRKNASVTFISAYLYGIPEKLPINEDHPLKPNNPYAVSKMLAENLCKFYCEHYHMKITVLRPFNVYGPGQDERFLIPTLIGQFYSHSEEIIVKDLTPKRDYIFITDLIEAMALSLNANEKYLVLNIGSGYSLSVSEVIQKISEVSGINKKIVSSGEVRPNEIPDTIADIEKAFKHLGWKPKTEFSEGIKLIIDKDHPQG